MTIEVMKQACEAAEHIYGTHWMYWDGADQDIAQKSITALRQAISQPDCRGCAQLHSDELCQLGCTNGDKFVPMPKVMLYKVTP